MTTCPDVTKGSSLLQSPRLFLRELHSADCPALGEIESDPVVTRYLPFDPRTPDETRTYIESAVQEQSAIPRLTYDLAIVVRDEHLHSRTPATLIGRCGLGIRRPEHREAVIWYELHPNQWGKGYAVEAATAVLKLGFGQLGLHRIWADCDPRNTASCRVAQHLGMKREGHLRENYYLKGEWCDTAVYGILEDEWRARHTA